MCCRLLREAGSCSASAHTLARNIDPRLCVHAPACFHRSALQIPSPKHDSLILYASRFKEKIHYIITDITQCFLSATGKYFQLIINRCERYYSHILCPDLPIHAAKKRNATTITHELPIIRRESHKLPPLLGRGMDTQSLRETSGNEAIITELLHFGHILCHWGPGRRGCLLLSPS